MEEDDWEDRALSPSAFEQAFGVTIFDENTWGHWGDWDWISTEAVAMTATYSEGGVKDACFLHALDGAPIARLSTGGARGPVVTSKHIVAGGGPLSGTPTVWDLATKKKLGVLKGHKRQCNGLGVVKGGATYVTIGGKNSTPFDNTLRLWDAGTFAESKKIKLAGVPLALATSDDRLVVRTWTPAATELHAFDAEGAKLWSIPDVHAQWVQFALSGDGRTLANVHEETLVLRDTRDGAVRASCSIEAFGDSRIAGGGRSPAFSLDDRFHFLSRKVGTIVIDVASCTPRALLRNVFRPRPHADGRYGAWLGTYGQVTHFGMLPATAVEPR